jgi:DNA-directed RNA polymerase subunit RPC12/RpoP
MENNEYKCAICHGIFNKGITDEEAVKEKRELVCDDCLEYDDNISPFSEENIHLTFLGKRKL